MQGRSSLTSRQIAPRIFSLPLAVCLGIAGSGWLIQAAIVPQPVQAYQAKVDIALERRAEDTYETLLRRAESVARAAAQRSFDQDILVTDVAITITAQGEGATVPLLTLEVSRSDWRRRPDTQTWATYFRGARTFLQFDRPAGGQTGTSAQPATPAPTPSPTASPSTGSPLPFSNPPQPTSIPQYSPNGQPVDVPRYTPGGPPLPVQNPPTQTTPSTTPQSTDETVPSQPTVPNIPRQRG